MQPCTHPGFRQAASRIVVRNAMLAIIIPAPLHFRELQQSSNPMNFVQVLPLE